MRHLIVPLTSTLCLAFALVAAPALAMPTLQAEEKKQEEHKHEHGEEHKLGEITLNESVFTVILVGHAHAGEEVEVKLMPKGALPKGTLRAWIGSENGKGSAKGKAHAEDGGLCVHAEVPKPIPAEAKVWVELEDEGNKSKAGVGLPKE